MMVLSLRLAQILPLIIHIKSEVANFISVREHKINNIGFTTYINTNVKWGHKITFFRDKN